MYIIERINSFKLLSFHVDCNHKPIPHVDSICATASNRLYFLSEDVKALLSLHLRSAALPYICYSTDFYKMRAQCGTIVLLKLSLVILNIHVYRNGF